MKFQMIFRVIDFLNELFSAKQRQFESAGEAGDARGNIDSISQDSIFHPLGIAYISMDQASTMNPDPNAKGSAICRFEGLIQFRQGCEHGLTADESLTRSHLFGEI